MKRLLIIGLLSILSTISVFAQQDEERISKSMEQFQQEVEQFMQQFGETRVIMDTLFIQGMDDLKNMDMQQYFHQFEGEEFDGNMGEMMEQMMKGMLQMTQEFDWSIIDQMREQIEKIAPEDTEEEQLEDGKKKKNKKMKKI